jgi:RHS repeat-associated protein
MLGGLVLLTSALGAWTAGAVEKGSQQVSPFYGSFSYAIPIEVPPFRGLEPSLALGYSSEGRNDLAGVGWSLSGFGLIERVNAGGGTATYTATDTYLLDGQMLVACQAGSVSPSCTTGGSHSTRIESFLKIRFDASTNTWTVWGKDGTRTLYTPIYDVPSLGTLRWGKTSVIDTKGNTVSYTWTCPAGACMPAAIQYNSYRIDVFYETRTDVSQTTGVTSILQNPYRIRSIFVWLVGVGHIRAYRLTYTTSPVSGRSLLSAVQHYGKDVTHDGAGLISGGTTLPPTSFTYQSDALAGSFVTQGSAPPTPPETVEPVVWSNRIRVYAWEAGNSLYKESGGAAWNAGAVSTRSITSGDGYAQATAAGANVIFGLSNGDHSQDYADIDFGLFHNGVDVYVSETGTLIGPFAVHTGDQLRVEVQGGVVRYKRNGTIFYTSTRTPTYPLLVDSAIYQMASVLQNVMISGALQQSSHWCPLPDKLLTGDFNADGFTDQLCGRGASGPTQVALGTATGFQAPTNWSSGPTSGQVTVGDFNGDGKADLSIYNNGNGDFHVSLSTGTSFGPYALWGNASALAPDGFPHHCTQHPAQTGVGDFNGDGRTDVSCKVAGHPEAFIGLNNGTSFVFSIFSQLSCDMYETTGSMDFNGDGKDDWYCMGLTGSEPFLVFNSTGSSFTGSPFGALSSSFCSSAGYILGDFNGDGRTDASCRYNGKVALSTGRSWVESGTYGVWCYDGTAFGADVDGDGTSEMICNNPLAGADDIQVRKWQHSGLGPVQTWKAGWCEGQTLSGDFNGDGKSDLLCTTQALVATGGSAGVTADLATSVTTPLGGVLQVAYAPSTGGPAGQPMNGPPTKQVVASQTTLDGRGGSSTTTFRYFGGYMDRAERRFMGFRVADQVKPCLPGETMCPYVRTYLRQDLAAGGQPEYVQHYVDPFGPTRQHWYEYQTATVHGVSSAVLSGEWDYTHDLTGCSTWPCPYKRTYATHLYDAYGNRSQTTNHGDYDAGGDEYTDAWDVHPNGAAYIVDRPARARRLTGIGTGGTRLTESYLLYDGSGSWSGPPAQGHLTSVQQWLDQGNRYVVRTIGRDAWGNPISHTDETGRVTTTTYDPSQHLFPESITNGAGDSEATLWDPRCGTPLQITDANGQASTFQTDPLCRRSRADHPLQGVEIIEYLDVGNPASQHVRVRTPSATPEDASGDYWTAQYIDGVGRVYQWRAKGPTASTTIVTDTAYNVRGGVTSRTAPHHVGEAAYATSYLYDGLDRLTTTTFPDGVAVTSAHSPWRVVHHDEHGHQTSHYFDSHGRRVRTERVASGQTHSTTHQYDLRGFPTSTSDTLGHTWTSAFDSLGRLYSHADPDAGTWTFEHDDAGRLRAKVDAKAQRTEFTYDAAGRVVSRSSPDGVALFGWSEPRPGYFNVERITSVTGGPASVTMDYDARGRTVRRVRTLEGVSYVVERRYDAADRLRGITYPDGEAIGTPTQPVTYDAAGRLRGIPGIVSNVTYDASGRPTSWTIPNGLVTTRTYSPQRGFLTAIRTTGPGSTIQDLGYTLDEAGMVSQVFSPFPKESWAYQYNDDHRLTSASNLTHPAESQAWAYDAIGRITLNSRAGSYTYPPSVSQQPHAPAVVAEDTYGYDDNGNRFLGPTGWIQWNASNLPTSINVNTFSYDGLGERVKKVWNGSTTLYPAGDDYEMRDGVVTKYISAHGLGVIAKRTSGQTFWLHTDRLGSIQVVTDVGGTEVHRRTYRPYGELIDASTSHVESRGWIDQRQDETGLTYLHARYYDPQLGVFLSPDPAQADLNAFAYANGNPTNLTDRSGLDPVPPTFPTEISCSSGGGGDGCPGGDSGGGSGLPGLPGHTVPGNSNEPPIMLPSGADGGGGGGGDDAPAPTPTPAPPPPPPPPPAPPETPEQAERRRHRDEEDLEALRKMVGEADLGAMVPGGTVAGMARKTAFEWAGGRITQSGFVRQGLNWLGSGYRQVVGRLPQDWRFLSADGLRSLRFGIHETRGKVLHGHFEAYDKAGGKVIENEYGGEDHSGPLIAGNAMSRRKRG